ncbi:hypothetical protein GCM10010441_29340 [Kitasatospora paracochleata]|uniref:Uncharacterized protein n=1 Tax=Kitasatospora paracochleata TaxID=58354 RepID=A0ABT1J8X9_9ACTN|nr:hypothetical protein [Kitasatospora paracochleata]MCP2313895.1 hypothetical protein [Kitasatospora paracochleata]
MSTKRGYAWGIGGTEYLIVPGEAWNRPPLTEHPQEAVRPVHPRVDTLALVDRVWHGGVSGDGYVHRIVEVVPTT